MRLRSMGASGAILHQGRALHAVLGMETGAPTALAGTSASGLAPEMFCTASQQLRGHPVMLLSRLW